MTSVAKIMTKKYIDTLEYVEKAEEIKDPKKLAAYQVKKIESALETVANEGQVHWQNLSTRKELYEVKSDLKSEISAVKTELKFEIIAVKTDLESQIITVKRELESQIATVKTDLEFQIAAVKTDLEAKILTLKHDLEAKMLMLKHDLEAKILETKTELIILIHHVDTKIDIKIAELRAEMIKFIVWTGIGVTVTLGSMLCGIFGVMVHEFHWF